MVLRLRDHSKGLQAQKVHLQKAQVLHRVLGELGGQDPVLGGQGDQFLERAVGNDDPCGMGPHVADHALDDLARIHDLLGDRVLLVFGGELRAFGKGVLKRNVEVVRDHLGQLVRLRIRKITHPGHVSYHHLGPEGPKSNDVRHAVAPVLFSNVLDDFPSSAHAEIDVEIGGRDPLWVKETLEEQAEAQGIDIGNSQNVGHQATRSRAPARTHGDSLFASPFHEVGHD